MLVITHTLLAGKIIYARTRNFTLEWVFTLKSLDGRAVSLAVLLSSYHLKMKRVRERDFDFVELLHASMTPFIGLDESLGYIIPPSAHSASVRLYADLLYVRVPNTFNGFVLPFDG